MLSEENYETPEVLKHLYALIGSIASTWSHIEQSVDVTLWWLAGLEAEIGACLTAQIQSLGYRLDALVAIVELRRGSKELVKTINKFRGKADLLVRKRNRVAHDPISSNDGEEPAAITITAQKTLTYGFSFGKTEEYTKIKNEVAQLLSQYLAIDKNIRIEFARTSHLRDG